MIVNISYLILLNVFKNRCPHCTDYYWNIRELNKHRNMHSEVKYVCETCGSSFANKDHFYAHCSSHSDKKKTQSDPNEQFICEICNKHFKSKGSIRNHMILHTGKLIATKLNHLICYRTKFNVWDSFVHVYRPV